MDIEFEYTPPKRNNFKINNQYSTPEKKTTPKDRQTPKRLQMCFQTPPKQSRMISLIQTPLKKNMNPQSRKSEKIFKNYENYYTSSSSNNNKDNNSQYKQYMIQSSGKKISQFSLSRLQTDYLFIRYLGSGNFSKVGLYRSRLAQQQFAIKITQLSLMSINQVQALGTLSILAQKSKNIIRYYHSWVENQHIYIVMEYCNYNLTKLFEDYKKQNKFIPEIQLKELLKQCLNGLKCMHQHNMVHLDIKPDNLLIKNKQIKISDLGLCRVTRIKKWSQIDEGDSRYLAKQVLNYHQGIDLKKADIYSLGLTFLQAAILQQLPNNGEKWLHIRDYGIDLTQIKQFDQYSTQFKQLITRMLHIDWKQRPSCEEILRSDYFQEKKSKRLSKFMNQIGGNSRKRQSSL